MLWIPGPTEVRPELLAIMATPMIGHRSAAMVELIERLDPGLRLAFGLQPDTTARVAVHSVSATAMMESALVGAGRGKLLCLVNGAFSRRWHQIAGARGLDARALEVPWGRVAEPVEVARVLAEEGPFDALTVVASETSTGTATPLAPLARILAAHPDTLLLVDLVSWIAGAPVDFDRNRLDFAFAGVQKAFALPPGISVLCASERYLERAASQPQRGYALDPLRTIEGHGKRKTPATPAIPHYFALAQQLEDIGRGVTLPVGERGPTGLPTGPPMGAAAWEARFAEHRRMQERTLEWARGHGLELFPPEELGSPTVSCIRAGSVDVARLVADLRERDLEISNGYGDLKGQTFRIGHMGDHTQAGLEQLLATMDEVLATQVA